MLTSLPAAVSEPTTPAWPAYRPFEVVVQRILPLSPHLVRVTFSGDDLGVFGTTGLDQRIKLVAQLVGGPEQPFLEFVEKGHGFRSRKRFP